MKSTRFSFISIHPSIFENFFEEGLLGKAAQKKVLDFEAVNPRDFADPPHHRVDDKPYGGGPGMVLKCEPIVRALRDIKSRGGHDESQVRSILLSAKGEPFDQRAAERLSSYKHLIFVCGRYEGVDERVADYYVDEELRIGDYVLMGGEVASMVMTEAIARLIPGVLGNRFSLEGESFSKEMATEYDQYTRPPEFEDHSVPEVLLNGNHSQIEKWRKKDKK